MFHTSSASCFLVVIEGGDKLGKHTQARLLEQNLFARGFKSILEEIPYKDGMTHQVIYNMLFNGEAVEHPLIFQTLQACNRRLFQAHRLTTLAHHYDVVVLDRWTPSTWVYGKASGITEEQDRVCQQGLAEPDLVFVFDGESYPTPEKVDDEYEKDRAFQRKVRNGYLEYVSRHENAFLVDANRPKETIAEELLTIVIKTLHQLTK